jgi:hypothetical protein
MASHWFEQPYELGAFHVRGSQYGICEREAFRKTTGIDGVEEGADYRGHLYAIDFSYLIVGNDMPFYLSATS